MMCLPKHLEGRLKDLDADKSVSSPYPIVRLVAQVVRVSVETVKIVDSLPTEYAAPTTEGETQRV
jgi:hypothetical protein